jgi:hypothetical protein
MSPKPVNSNQWHVGLIGYGARGTDWRIEADRILARLRSRI